MEQEQDAVATAISKAEARAEDAFLQAEAERERAELEERKRVARIKRENEARAKESKEDVENEDEDKELEECSSNSSGSNRTLENIKRDREDRLAQAKASAKARATLKITKNLTRLRPGRMYTIVVRVINAKGPGKWSEELQANTMASVPTEPSAPMLISASPMALSLCWTKPAFDNGAAVNGYSLEMADLGPESAQERQDPSFEVINYGQACRWGGALTVLHEEYFGTDLFP